MSIQKVPLLTVQANIRIILWAHFTSIKASHTNRSKQHSLRVTNSTSSLTRTIKAIVQITSAADSLLLIVSIGAGFSLTFTLLISLEPILAETFTIPQNILLVGALFTNTRFALGTNFASDYRAKNTKATLIKGSCWRQTLAFVTLDFRLLTVNAFIAVSTCITSCTSL